MKTMYALVIVAQVAGSAAAQTSTTTRQPVRPVTGAQTPAPATGDTRTKPPTVTGTRGTAAESVSTDYHLVPGDKLRIEVYREPQLSQSVEIRPDGKVTLPLVGDIAASGVTTTQLSATLTERFKEYVTTPVVTVIVAEATTPMVYVMGEVRTPGSQVLRGPLTVLQALAVAGGFNEFANTKKIRILRRSADGSVQTVKFNYKDALAHPERPMMLQAGDTVIVP